MYTIDPVTGEFKEIPYDKSNIVLIDNNGHSFTPDWANKPID